MHVKTFVDAVDYRYKHARVVAQGKFRVSICKVSPFARQRRHKFPPTVETEQQVRRFVYKLKVISATTVYGTMQEMGSKHF